MKKKLTNNSGSITCDVCGMSYIPKLQDNSRHHNKYHDKIVNGLCTSPLKSDNVIWSQEDMRLTVVNQLSLPDQHKRAEEVAKYARKDAGYDSEVVFDKEMEVCVFLLHKADRAVGFILMDKRDHVWRASWDDVDAGEQPKDMPQHPPMWTVCLVWILKKYRCLGFARDMLDKVLLYLGCSMNQIGWYTPFTDCGKAFVRRCCPNEFYIAK